MKVSEASLGRVFVIRLEHGDRMPEAVERFARERNVLRGFCMLVGGVDDGGNIIVGPEDGNTRPVVPIPFQLEGVHEVLGVGAIFPDELGEPKLHMHAALGRDGVTRAGCIRPGIETWQVGEVIIFELYGTRACRRKDPNTGFELLDPDPDV